VRHLAGRLPVLLLAVLAACSTRSVHTDIATPQASLVEGKANRLIAIWQEQLRQYINREGKGDPAVLSQTRPLHAADVLRPGRITFGVLDADADLPGHNGWDVQGVLIGKQESGGRNWYVFVVGMIRRSDYRPRDVEDIRIVALAADGGKGRWKTSAAEPQAVRRYRDAFAGSDTVRFPDDTDKFDMTVSEGQVHVRETQSGATWTLRLSTGSGSRMTLPAPSGPA
jgi:hypothetical protein